MAAKIRKGDEVIILTGRDKGKKGEVLEVNPSAQRAVVRGINKIKRHQRQTPNQSGGIVEKEASIHLSNIALLDPKTKKPTRIGFKLGKDGTKLRIAKRSGETLNG